MESLEHLRYVMKHKEDNDYYNKKYNPDTKEGDVIGGYVQSDSKGGFASGDMYFKAAGSISYIKDGVIVEFDKNGNVISENTKQ